MHVLVCVCRYVQQFNQLSPVFMEPPHRFRVGLYLVNTGCAYMLQSGKALAGQ